MSDNTFGTSDSPTRYHLPALPAVSPQPDVGIELRRTDQDADSDAASGAYDGVGLDLHGLAPTEDVIKASTRLQQVDSTLQGMRDAVLGDLLVNDVETGRITADGSAARHPVPTEVRRRRVEAAESELAKAETQVELQEQYLDGDKDEADGSSSAGPIPLGSERVVLAQHVLLTWVAPLVLFAGEIVAVTTALGTVLRSDNTLEMALLTVPLLLFLVAVPSLLGGWLHRKLHGKRLSAMDAFAAAVLVLWFGLGTLAGWTRTTAGLQNYVLRQAELAVVPVSEVDTSGYPFAGYLALWTAVVLAGGVALMAMKATWSRPRAVRWIRARRAAAACRVVLDQEVGRLEAQKAAVRMQQGITQLVVDTAAVVRDQHLVALGEAKVATLRQRYVRSAGDPAATTALAARSLRAGKVRQ